MKQTQQTLGIELRAPDEVKFDAAMARARAWWAKNPGEIYPCECATCSAYRGKS